MKRAIEFVSGSLLCASPALVAGADAGGAKKDVNVYEVPWVCPAAQQIGCGSHSKPVLLELEKNLGVSEAWLNRQGTAVAVVWKPAPNARRGARWRRR